MTFMKPLLLLLMLASCASPDAGRVAARATDGVCVEFTRYGKPDTAALFRHDSYWWRYHASKGSVRTPWKSSEPAPIGTVLPIKGAEGPIRKVEVGNIAPSPLPNGCLPTAIMRQRLTGGRIMQVAEHHVEHVR